MDLSGIAVWDFGSLNQMLFVRVDMHKLFKLKTMFSMLNDLTYANHFLCYFYFPYHALILKCWYNSLNSTVAHGHGYLKETTFGRQSYCKWLKGWIKYISFQNLSRFKLLHAWACFTSSPFTVIAKLIYVN